MNISKRLPIWMGGAAIWVLSLGFLRRKSRLVAYRNDGRESAIVFVHGFWGDASKTWGKFPKLLSDHSGTDDCDIFFLGYPTSLCFDLIGIWSADPPIGTLADRLRTVVGLGPLNRYKKIVLIAHSMGGLVVQRALVDDDTLPSRFSHVFLFGTPSAGLLKASLFASIKRQLNDMAEGSLFITDLRSRWTQKFGSEMPFSFLTIAGDRDEFVPRSSSIDVFPQEYREVVSGNHLQIVKPKEIVDESIGLVLSVLTIDGQKKRIEEKKKFELDVKALEKDKLLLDNKAIVELAIRMDRLGRQDDAIGMLKDRVDQMLKNGNPDTEVMGVLAGRLKRRWMFGRLDADGKKALDLYSDAFGKSANNPGQAFYNGINQAFMTYFYLGQIGAAQKIAKEVLSYCSKARSAEAKPDLWRLATEGEAYLYLGRLRKAMKRYREAVRAAPQPWQLDSMQQQASWIINRVGDRTAVLKFRAVFLEGE